MDSQLNNPTNENNNIQIEQNKQNFERRINELVNQLMESNPDIIWTDSLLNTLRRDLSNLLIQFLKLDNKALTGKGVSVGKLVGGMKHIFYPIKKLTTHQVPDHKGQATGKIKSSLDSHTIIGRATTVASGMVSADVFMALLEGFGQSASPAFASGFGILVYTFLQKLKEDAIDQTEYDTAELKILTTKKPREQIGERKRILAGVLISICVGLISSYNTLVRLPSGDTEAIKNYQVDKVKFTLVLASQEDNQVGTQIKKLIKERNELLEEVNYDTQSLNSTNRKKLANIDFKVSDLSLQDSIFKFLPQQLEAETKYKYAEFLMTPSGKKTSDKTDYYYSFHHNLQSGRDGSGYDIQTKQIDQEIKQLGGKYIENNLPLTVDQKRFSDFEAIAIASDPKKTIIEYYKLVGRPQEGLELIKEIETGEFFKKLSEGQKLEIGRNRIMHKIFAEKQLPTEVISALLILLIESITIINTGRLLLDREFQNIYWNKDLQHITKNFTNCLIETISRELDVRNINYKPEIVAETVQGLCQFGKLEIMRQITDSTIRDQLKAESELSLMKADTQTKIIRTKKELTVKDRLGLIKQKLGKQNSKLADISSKQAIEDNARNQSLELQAELEREKAKQKASRDLYKVREQSIKEQIEHQNRINKLRGR